MMRLLCDKTGFTLIEMMTVVVIFSLVLGAAMSMTLTTIKTRNDLAEHADLQLKASTALDIIAQDVRYADGVTTCTDYMLQLHNPEPPNGTYISFNLAENGDKLYKDIEPICSNVNRVGKVFSLQDASGDPTTDPTKASSVIITLNVGPSDNQIEVSSSVQMRNKP